MLLTAGMIASLAACGNAEQTNTPESTPKSTMEPIQTENARNGTEGEALAEQTVIRLAFGDTVMSAVLDGSETSRAFIKMLPLTLTMNRYADREYYAALGELPKNGAAIDDFENGDVTYYTLYRRKIPRDFLWQCGYVLSERPDPHGADHLRFESV